MYIIYTYIQRHMFRGHICWLFSGKYTRVTSSYPHKLGGLFIFGFPTSLEHYHGIVLDYNQLVFDRSPGKRWCPSSWAFSWGSHNSNFTTGFMVDIPNYFMGVIKCYKPTFTSLGNHHLVGYHGYPIYWVAKRQGTTYTSHSCLLGASRPISV